MIPTIAQFNQLSQSDKIKLIQQYAPHLLNSLKKNISNLSIQELSNLFEFAKLEASAKDIANSFTLDLTNFLTNYSTIIEPVLKELKLSDSETNLLDNIFKKTLVFAVTKASSYLYDDLKKGEGLLYSAILSEQTITVLEGILDFKKSIDKNFPGLSDIIIAKSTPVLVTLASTYSPPLGLVLKSTGILSKVADFLKTENLDKTVTNMYHSLDKIKQDKTLAEIQITSNKVTEIAKQISSPSLSNNLISISRSIEKFNLKFDTAIETSEEISRNVSSKKLLTIVADYAQTYIPSSEREINEKLATVKSSVLENLEKNGVPKAVIMEVTEVMDQNIEKAKLEMKKCLNKEDKIIDKIGHILIAADILNQTESHIISIGKKTPSHTTALKKCTQQLKLEVNNKVRGDVSKIAKEMTSDSPAKEFAKKILGVNLANEILIKRALPAKSLGRSPL